MDLLCFRRNMKRLFVWHFILSANAKFYSWKTNVVSVFCVLFSTIYLKINFMAKNRSDLSNINTGLFFFFFFFFFLAKVEVIFTIGK